MATESDLDRMRQGALERIERSERRYKLAFVMAALFEASFLIGFVLLSAMVVITIVGVAFEVPEGNLVWAIAAFLPLNYGIAVAGVGRARRGDVPEWYWWSRRIKDIGRWLPRRRRPFASAAWAQVWFEWRRHGSSLPFFTACVQSPPAQLAVTRGVASVTSSRNVASV